MLFRKFLENSGRFVRNYCYKPVKRFDSNAQQMKKKNPSRDSDNPQLRTQISLTSQLKSKILATGPITVADYMREVLTNPMHGYYMNRDVFGTTGDFITSPEINQIFGELIAIWCLTEWQKIGSPNPLQLIELGPGRGTLTKDILRVFSHFRLGSQLSLHLVEVSPHLSRLQAQQLCVKYEDVDSNTDTHENNLLYYRKGETASGVKVYWYRVLDSIPQGFSIVIAHEFFDALPIHKLQLDNGVWKEILIDIDPNEENKFRMILSKSQTPISKIFRPLEDENRTCLEYSIETEKLINQLIDRFEKDGGFGLIIDYGHFGEKSDTFRAFKKHQLHDPLVEPGSADLTSDVDFKLIKTVAEQGNRMITFGPIEQRIFLKCMEGEARLKVLLDKCLPENEEQIKSGYEMLINPEKMGDRFKFFAIFPVVLKEHLKKFPVSGFSNSK